MLETFSYAQGVLTGRISIILYILTLVPGICRRFGIKHKGVSLLTLYRRKIGIAMYIFAVLHALAFVSFTLKIPTFKVFGLLAFIILLPLFVTSNTLSIQKLKHNWKKIHQLTYPALGLIFLHTVLIRTSFYSITAFLTLILLVASFVTERINRTPSKVK